MGEHRALVERQREQIRRLEAEAGARAAGAEAEAEAGAEAEEEEVVVCAKVVKKYGWAIKYDWSNTGPWTDGRARSRARRRSI